MNARGYHALYDEKNRRMGIYPGAARREMDNMKRTEGRAGEKP